MDLQAIRRALTKIGKRRRIHHVLLHVTMTISNIAINTTTITKIIFLRNNKDVFREFSSLPSFALIYLSETSFHSVCARNGK